MALAMKGRIGARLETLNTRRAEKWKQSSAATVKLPDGQQLSARLFFLPIRHSFLLVQAFLGDFQSVYPQPRIIEITSFSKSHCPQRT
jgi:hypothetical protein